MPRDYTAILQLEWMQWCGGRRDWCNLNEDRCVNGCGNGATWCLTATPAPTTNGYCNWNGCDGRRLGDDWCNLNEERCAECGNEQCGVVLIEFVFLCCL